MVWDRVGSIKEPTDDAFLGGLALALASAAVVDGGDVTPSNTLELLKNPGFEVDATGWGVNSNATIARVTTEHKAGVGAGRMRSVAAGNMSISQDFPGGPLTTIPVTSGATYNVVGWLKAATVGRTCQVQVQWFDNAGASIRIDTVGSVPDVTTGWTQLSGTVTAPAGALTAQFYVFVLATGAANEDHFFDEMSLTENGVLVAGGVSIFDGIPTLIPATRVGVQAADATNPRLDLVVSSKTSVVSIVAGTPSTVPVLPALPANSVMLGQISVPATDVTIDSTQLTDLRTIVSLDACLNLIRSVQMLETVAGTIAVSSVGPIAAPAQTNAAAATDGATNEAPFVKLNTAASIGSVSKLLTGFTVLNSGWLPVFRALIRTGNSVANVRLWAGIFSGDPGSGAAASLIGLRFDTSVGESQWSANTGNSSVYSLAGTGVNVTADTTYEIVILTLGVRGSLPTGAAFFINGVLVAILTTNLPALGRTLGAGMTVAALAASARSLLINSLTLATPR